MSLSLSLVTIVVTDYDAALAFFVGVLGLVCVEDSPAGPGKRWVVVRPSGGGAGFLLAKAASETQRGAIGNQTGGRVGFFLMADDFVAEHTRLTAAGVAFEEAPRCELYGMVAVFRDPFGNRWDLLGPPPAH